MSLIIKNVAASNKLLLPNGKPLKIGSEIKVAESILGSSLSAINPMAAVTNVADLVSEVQEAVSSVTDAVKDDSSLTILSDSEQVEEIEEKPKSRRRSIKKDED